MVPDNVTARETSFDVNLDIDPDINLLSPTITCEYYDQDQYLNKYTSNNCQKLLHINARSLTKNIDNIRDYITILGDNFPIIGISESWLNDLNDPLIRILGYISAGTSQTNEVVE